MLDVTYFDGNISEHVNQLFQRKWQDFAAKPFRSSSIRKIRQLKKNELFLSYENGKKEDINLFLIWHLLLSFEHTNIERRY